MNEDDDYLFASCKIEWEIENFWLPCALKKCSIFSPEFMLQGLKSVDWRLILEVEDDSPEERKSDEVPEETESEILTEKRDSKEISQDEMVSVYLELLPTSQVKDVSVNWEIRLMAGCKIYGPFQRKVEYGKDNKHGQIRIATINEIFDCLPPLKSDTVAISFYFIAFNKDKFSIPSDDKSLGMYHLHKDLKFFKDMDDNLSDVTLKVKDKIIKAHKIILCCNEIFRIYIEKATSNVIEIKDFDYETLNALINFLYSRELKYCLEYLSISMIRCLEHFKCDSLKPYYIPEELPMRSNLKIEKHDFHWYVPDFLDNEDIDIMSPPIKRFDLNTTWLLTVSMNATNRNGLISVFAEIIRGDKPKYFCLEFALLSECGKEYFPKRLVINNESYANTKNLGFNEFVKKRDICERRHLLINDGCVRFLFRVRTSDATQECALGCHAMSFTLPNKLKPYNEMSKKMVNFYMKEIFSDITIRCKDKKRIKANRFILEARSPGFIQKYKNSSLPPGFIDVFDTDYYLLRTCVKYLYTGVLEEDCETIVELFKISAPNHLDIPSLHKDCDKYLRERNACYYKKPIAMYLGTKK